METKLKKNSTIVAFHCGRGGRYNNSGYVSFIGNKNINQFTDDLFGRFENEMDFKDRFGFDETRDKHQRCILDLITDGDFDELEEKFGITKEMLGKEIYFNCGGNSVGLDVENDGTGIINIDNEYNTTSAIYLSECIEDDLIKILESNHWNNIDLIQEYFDECTYLDIDWGRFNGDYHNLINDYFHYASFSIEDYYVAEEDGE